MHPIIRKRLDQDLWQQFEKRRYQQYQCSTPFFNGRLGMLQLIKVGAFTPWRVEDRTIQVIGNGYKWFQILPDGENYCIKMVLDENERIVLWYIDIIRGSGTAQDGVAYFDDLYLDIIVFDDGHIVIDDMDELQEAYDEQLITKDDYLGALQTQQKLQRGLLSDINAFTKFCYECMALTQKKEHLRVDHTYSS